MTDEQEYAIILEVNPCPSTRAFLGYDFISNTLRPHLLRDTQDYNTLCNNKRKGSTVVRGTKEFLINNPFDVCEEDFKEPLDVDGKIIKAKE